MTDRVLVDTGPLVAVANKADEYHAICTETLRGLSVPLYSCWPVITEAAWLLRERPMAVENLLRSVTGGLMHLLPVQDMEAESLAKILERYRNLRLQLADATLMHLAIRERIDTIFTLDRRDFSVLRTYRNRPFRILPVPSA